jgi:hypothetical protein
MASRNEGEVHRDAGVRKVILVGDRFSGFAAQHQVSTVGCFIRALRDGSYDDLPDPLVVRAGQSVDQADLADVVAAIAERKLCLPIILRTARGTRKRRARGTAQLPAGQEPDGAGLGVILRLPPPGRGRPRPELSTQAAAHGWRVIPAQLPS